MANTSELLRGHTDTILLGRLIQGDSYGYELSRDIAQATGGALEFKEATLYTAFRRLEDAGYIRSYWGEPQSGARRRYYAVTEEGKEAFREGQAQWQALRGMMDALIGGKE